MDAGSVHRVVSGMQTTTINELLSKGFTEDPRAIKLIQRPFLIPCIPALGVYVVSFACLVLKKGSIGVNLALLAGSWCFIGLMLLCLYKSRPKSRHTGKPLSKYKNSFPDSNVGLELIYVCPESKTFSRRVYLVKGGSAAACGVP